MAEAEGFQERSPEQRFRDESLCMGTSDVLFGSSYPFASKQSWGGKNVDHKQSPKGTEPGDEEKRRVLSSPTRGGPDEAQ